MQNATPAPASATSAVPALRPRRHLFWKVIGVAALVWCVAVAMLAIEAVTLSHHAGQLRRAMLVALELPAHTKVQLTVGPGALAAARTALCFVHDAPPEAKDALRAVRSASVGVYELTAVPTPAARRKLLDAADHALGRHGWTRVVGVNNPGETVMIYTPVSDDDVAMQQVCVAVCDAERLVIVEGEIDGRQLAGLVARMNPAKLALR